MHPKPKDDKQRGLWENKRSQFVSSPENVSYSHFDIITREGPNPKPRSLEWSELVRSL